MLILFPQKKGLLSSLSTPHRMDFFTRINLFHKKHFRLCDQANDMIAKSMQNFSFRFPCLFFLLFFFEIF